MEQFSWVCPFCHHAASIRKDDNSYTFHVFDWKNRAHGLETHSITCPNASCKEVAIKATLFAAQLVGGGMQWKKTGAPIQHWALRPASSAKLFPDYIPAAILQDYQEACSILTLSPKASATLSRRCLQGMIRDFWGITRNRLIDEVRALEEKTDAITWKAIDSLREIGNIGAHMEKDIGQIIDVDPEEAQLLIELIEYLLTEWYVHRHEREQHLQRLISVGQAKGAAKDAAKVEKKSV